MPDRHAFERFADHALYCYTSTRIATKLALSDLRPSNAPGGCEQQSALSERVGYARHAVLFLRLSEHAGARESKHPNNNPETPEAVGTKWLHAAVSTR